MNGQVNTDFGRRIRFCRERKGWTQIQAAKAMGVQRTSLNRWENGHEMPSGGNMTKLRDHLQIPIGTREEPGTPVGGGPYQLVLPFDRPIEVELRVTPKGTSAVQFQVQLKAG